jgi:hypothetical protein
MADRADALSAPGRPGIVHVGGFSEERSGAATAGVCDDPWPDIMRRLIRMLRQNFVPSPGEVPYHKEAGPES